jgi:hypothetical protein
MSGSLVLLPLRLGLRATGLVVRGAPPLNQSEAVDYDAPSEAEPVHVDEGSELARRR